MTNKIRQFYNVRPWTARFIIALIIFCLLIIGARLALSPSIIYGANSWLKKQGIDSAIEAVNINILHGTVSLVNARGIKDNQPLYNIGLVDIHWEWRPLSKKTIVVTKVALDSISVNIEQYSDAIIISGITIPLGAADEAAQETDAAEVDEDIKAWAASLGEVVFTNLDVCYLQHTSPLQQADNNTKNIDYCVELEEMDWAGTISYATDQALLASGALPLSSTGDFRLDGLSIKDNRLGKTLLTSSSNTLNNVVITGLNKLHIDQLEMDKLSLLQRDDDRHIDSVRFSRLVVNDITLSELNSLVINDISVSEPGVYMVKLDQNDWEYQQWIPQAPPDSNKLADNNVQQDNASAFSFALNELNIDDSDLCYLDRATTVYYGLTIKGLGWDGSVKYNTPPSAPGSESLLVKGNLRLTRPVIHNQTLGRDLLNFAELDLAGLALTGTDNISLNRFELKELHALQRGESPDDNTLSFDELKIDDVKYSGSGVAVNTISLTGLANTVSKNKNGEWEHDKWLPQEENSETGKTQGAELAEADASTDKTPANTDGNKPFSISLNDLNITSDRKIQFIDNSTQPVMEVGLASLAFDISKLNSDNPDADSPFKLQAKTSRHGAIDIKGTIKPFAEKISLNADGKLKGFDLRVASPAVKKAVGHIIQSGQLDADLDLKAVQGELDSEISLSLYQFQMKSVSKDDAKKLDEKFGMPLNQALVLLRDKDDSIHLDIPITGDINNPEFDPMDAIIKATSKATTVTLITFYTPYGLIYHGGKMALDLATALNFDPIQFAPGSAELQQSGKKQLDGLSKLLMEKPKVHLTLCGVTNQQDELALFPKPVAKKGQQVDKEVSKDIPLTNEQVLKLKQLASERQDNSKNYLVNQHGIDHSRLILCEPEHNTAADAIAGVEINI